MNGQPAPCSAASRAAVGTSTGSAPAVSAPHVRHVVLGTAPWHPGVVLEVLRGSGLRRVLIEGGGRTVSAWLAAGALDRLYLTTVPVLLGDGVPGVRVPAVPRIADAPRWPVRRFALGDDLCTEFTLR